MGCSLKKPTQETVSPRVGPLALGAGSSRLHGTPSSGTLAQFGGSRTKVRKYYMGWVGWVFSSLATRLPGCLGSGGRKAVTEMFSVQAQRYFLKSVEKGWPLFKREVGGWRQGLSYCYSYDYDGDPTVPVGAKLRKRVSPLVSLCGSAGSAPGLLRTTRLLTPP